MSTNDKTAALAALKTRFAQDQSGVLEDIARENGLTTREVMACLPPDRHTVADGSHFEKVMAEVAGWGEITFLVHTTDVILEYKGSLPPGRIARGFFNLLGKPVSGHIRFENCTSIHFLRRAFMTLDTAAIVFVNREGEPMFKIFAGRNVDRSLKADHVAAFERLIVDLGIGGVS
jgi:putative heme utilization carrier protein HutX